MWKEFIYIGEAVQVSSVFLGFFPTKRRYGASTPLNIKINFNFSVLLFNFITDLYIKLRLIIIFTMYTSYLSLYAFTGINKKEGKLRNQYGCTRYLLCEDWKNMKPSFLKIMNIIFP